ncbi:MAG TPA: DUF4394 domain-containing protein [Thiobacillus sp.]|nr:DUF4394 domain-containing protein [Thiobacillus sp.]HQT70684.1 DUF4394 domain-containing protein [Thiobacillus sp.]
MKRKQKMAGTLAILSLALAAGSAQAVSLVGLTTDNRLTVFDSTTPAMTSPYLAITGVTAGARIVGIDTRPGDNQIYGVGTDNLLYTLDAATGVATQKATLTGATIMSSLSYGIDFNPVADAAGGASLRLVTSAGNNYAINANTGVIGNTANMLPGGIGIGGVAYTNSVASPAPASTGLYYIDYTNDLLLLAPTGFNAPAIQVVGSLGMDSIGAFGFEILADGSAFATLTSGVSGQSGLYRINLANGSATLLGGFGAASPLLAGLTAAPMATPVPEADTYALLLAGLGVVALAVRRRGRLQAA